MAHARKRQARVEMVVIPAPLVGMAIEVLQGGEEFLRRDSKLSTEQRRQGAALFAKAARILAEFVHTS